ncbi:hypothetical protein LCGC14_2038550 [marine sediment metagenome]|uniref:Uncharacterized protein n=1 Tax=marine sediment metagenome TaxID=412755 RepID=A0A0F9FF64_9ZZZZ
MKPQYVNEEGKELFGIPDLNKKLGDYNEVLKENTRSQERHNKLFKTAIIIGSVIAIGFFLMAAYGLIKIEYWNLISKWFETCA